jgi:hypothetical protein
MSLLPVVVKNRLEKKCNVCFFLQNNDCILRRNRVIPCDMKVKKITGITDIEFYVGLISSRRLSQRALYFSILSLAFAFLSLLINFVRLLNS